MVENGIREGVSHAVLWLTKTNNKHFDESKDTPSNLTYLEKRIFMGWQCVEITSEYGLMERSIQVNWNVFKEI